MQDPCNLDKHGQLIIKIFIYSIDNLHKIYIFPLRSWQFY